jgi:hypothetical protein
MEPSITFHHDAAFSSSTWVVHHYSVAPIGIQPVGSRRAYEFLRDRFAVLTGHALYAAQNTRASPSLPGLFAGPPISHPSSSCIVISAPRSPQELLLSPDLCARQFSGLNSSLPRVKNVYFSCRNLPAQAIPQVPWILQARLISPHCVGCASYQPVFSPRFCGQEM